MPPSRFAAKPPRQKIWREADGHFHRRRQVLERQRVGRQPHVTLHIFAQRGLSAPTPAGKRNRPPVRLTYQPVNAMPTADPMVACQMYVCSQIASEQAKPLDDLLDGFLEDIAAAGFSAIEWDLERASTSEKALFLIERAGRFGLAVPTLYAGGAFHTKDEADRTVPAILRAADAARSVGTVGLIVNPDPIGREKTDAELACQAEALDELGAGLRDIGMWLAVHTHDVEMRHNAREFRWNLEKTEPDLVGLCADVHWIYRGGQDPVLILRQYLGRVRSLHLRQSRQAVWCEELGAGDVEYWQIADLLNEARWQGPLVLELAYEPRTQRTRSFREALARSRAYIRGIFGR